jgi:hypothetical protein
MIIGIVLYCGKREHAWLLFTSLFLVVFGIVVHKSLDESIPIFQLKKALFCDRYCSILVAEEATGPTGVCLLEFKVPRVIDINAKIDARILNADPIRVVIEATSTI